MAEFLWAFYGRLDGVIIVGKCFIMTHPLILCFSFCFVFGGPGGGFGGPGGGFLLNSLSSGFAITFTTITKPPPGPLEPSPGPPKPLPEPTRGLVPTK